MMETTTDLSIFHKFFDKYTCLFIIPKTDISKWKTIKQYVAVDYFFFFPLEQMGTDSTI